MSDQYINTGNWGKVEWGRNTSISTSNLGPCIAVVTNNGVVAHVNPDWGDPDAPQQFVDWLKKNASPPYTRIALIGGMDDNGRIKRSFGTSAELAKLLEHKLGEAGYEVVHRDLFGMRQREVVLKPSGEFTVTDAWDEGHKVSGNFNAAPVVERNTPRNREKTIGRYAFGTVFEIAKTAAGYTSTLISFNGTNGAAPLR
jgi:hypothetical protein